MVMCDIMMYSFSANNPAENPHSYSTQAIMHDRNHYKATDHSQPIIYISKYITRLEYIARKPKIQKLSQKKSLHNTTKVT